MISLESLEVFDLIGCSSLEKFPDVVGNMQSLGLLYLNGTGIREVPPSFKNLSALSRLSFQDCKELSNLQSDMCRLSALRFLELSGCYKLEKLLDLSSMERLEGLYAVGTGITQLSPNPLPKSIKILRLSGTKLSPDPFLKSIDPHGPEFWCVSGKGCDVAYYSPNESKILHVEVGSGSCEVKFFLYFSVTISFRMSW